MYPAQGAVVAPYQKAAGGGREHKENPCPTSPDMPGTAFAHGELKRQKRERRQRYGQMKQSYWRCGEQWSNSHKNTLSSADTAVPV